MTRTLRSARCGAGMLVLFLLAGCGGSGELVSATGTVTLDGEPLAGVIVEFHPVSDTGSTASFGLTGADGRFRMMRTAFESGVAPGEYLVRFYCETEAGGVDCRDSDESQVVIPERYQTFSELRVTVEDRRRNRLDFDLTTP